MIRAAEGDIRSQQALGRETEIVTVGRKPEGYFRFRNYPISAALGGFTQSPTYEDARQVAAAVIGPFQEGELDLVQLTYTRFVSAGRQEVVIVPLLPLPDLEIAMPVTHASAVEHAAAAEHAGPSAAYEFEPDPDAILERAPPALRRGAHLRRVAQRGRLRARGAPARDEGGHRQRRRLDHRAQPGDEPRPSGADHHGDHGDRRRRRSLAIRAARPTSTSVSISAA